MNVRRKKKFLLGGGAVLKQVQEGCGVSIFANTQLDLDEQPDLTFML